MCSLSTHVHVGTAAGIVMNSCGVEFLFFAAVLSEIITVTTFLLYTRFFARLSLLVGYILLDRDLSLAVITFGIAGNKRFISCWSCSCCHSVPETLCLARYPSMNEADQHDGRGMQDKSSWQIYLLHSIILLRD